MQDFVHQQYHEILYEDTLLHSRVMGSLGTSNAHKPSTTEPHLREVATQRLHYPLIKEYTLIIVGSPI